jgi:DNA polymerase III subunit epsilon
MREIILDTETTGLDPAQGHRVVEIGALELLNHVPTGQTFHVYINPERDMPAEAEAVHGLSTAFLRDKPPFSGIADEFLTFIAESVVVIHNAAFDVSFLNAELGHLGKGPLLAARVVDTLQLARRKHPMGPNSLDALCRRYGVDNSKRTRHGALLDSELLAEVYIELIGGRQTALSLAGPEKKTKTEFTGGTGVVPRSRPLAGRLTALEREAHARLVEELGSGALWKTLEQ